MVNAEDVDHCIVHNMYFFIGCECPGCERDKKKKAHVSGVREPNSKQEGRKSVPSDGSPRKRRGKRSLKPG